MQKQIEDHNDIYSAKSNNNMFKILIKSNQISIVHVKNVYIPLENNFTCLYCIRLNII